MQKKENNKKEINKQVVIIVASIIATVLCTIGVTLAAFVWNDESQKEQKVVVGDLNLTISSTSKPLGSDLDVPVKDDEIDDLTPYEFTVKNTGKVDAYFKLKIADDTEAIKEDECTENQIDKQYIGIKVTEKNSITGLLKDYEKEPIDYGVLKPDETKTYKLYLWLKGDVPNEVIGKHYHGKILLETEQTIDNERSLADAILNDNTPVEETPTFTTTSTDVGLFKLQDDIALNEDETLKDVYYFRGPVENNYVEFGTYTKEISNTLNNINTEVAKAGDPILWRVVRINEDGSVKLIAEHNIENKFYVWDTKSPIDYATSIIKTKVETWYNETYINPEGEQYQSNKKLDNLVVETEFCNDKSENYSGAKTRLTISTDHSIPEPTVKCPQSTDIIKSKAGLITADEMVYAGALYNKTVTSRQSYLNNTTYFWTMTPGSPTSVCCWNPDIIILNTGAYNRDQAAARPVITLSASALVKADFLSESDPGTIDNPYKVIIK